MDSDEGYNYEFDEDEECSEEDSGAEEEEDEDDDEPDDDNLDRSARIHVNREPSFGDGRKT